MKALRRKSPSRRSGIKTDKLDRIFSRLVRERAGWKCERCGTQYEVHAQGLHCSHLMSRRCKALRWHPENAVAHCFSCHLWFGGNPLLASDWIDGYCGKETASRLRSVFHQYIPVKKADLEEIYLNLKSEYDRMLTERVNGKLGRIEFLSPYPESYGGTG